MKTKEEIIKETAEFYNIENRAYEAGSCLYHTKENKMCAVGRCMEDAEGFPYRGSVESIFYSRHESGALALDQYLKPEYRGHSLQFWQDLQYFHDVDTNWDSEGMSGYGKRAMMNLLNSYCTL